MSAPFAVLHVCTGNICRSPMSERILDGLTGDDVLNHGAGISAYHDGEDMTGKSAAELRDRGFEPDGHRARHIERAHVESSDLVLVATEAHIEYIADRFPEALDRTFLVRQFGLIVADMLEKGLDDLPQGDTARRGRALVAAAAKRTAEYPRPDLADPWGMDQRTYARIADQLEDALRPVATVLTGPS